MVLPIETILLFAGVIMAASLSPGPNVMIVINHSVQFGVRKIAPTIFGNLCCLLCLAFLAAFGAGAILQTSLILFNSLKVCGGLYLLYMGIKAFRLVQQNVSTEETNHTNGEAEVGKTRFWEAFLVSASNPKSILFLASVFPAFVNLEAPVTQQFAILFTVIICVVSTIHFGYALMAATLSDVVRRIDFRVWVARFSGLVFIALGGLATVSGFSYFYG